MLVLCELFLEDTYRHLLTPNKAPARDEGAILLKSNSANH